MLEMIRAWVRYDEIFDSMLWNITNDLFCKIWMTINDPNDTYKHVFCWYSENDIRITWLVNNHTKVIKNTSHEAQNLELFKYEAIGTCWISPRRTQALHLDAKAGMGLGVPNQYLVLDRSISHLARFVP